MASIQTTVLPRRFHAGLVLPILFAGYALVANATFVTGLAHDTRKIPQGAGDYLNGAAAAQIDSYYKSILPHRAPSVDLLGALRYLAFGEGRPGVVVGKEGWLFTSEEFRAATIYADPLDNAVRHLVAVRDQLAAAGIDLVIVPLPAKADVEREHLADPQIGADLEDLYGRFEAAIAASGINAADVRSAIVKARSEGPVFLTRDTHWTPLGATAAAQAIAAQVPSLTGTTEYALRPGATTERTGDLTKFLVEGAFARPLGLLPQTVHPVTAEAVSTDASSGDIFGDAAIPIALVGTSYSANEDWSFAPELKAALHSDVLNLAEEGEGPAVPMHKFLISDTFNSSPPKTVIWEFPVRYLATPGLWDSIDAGGKH